MTTEVDGSSAPAAKKPTTRAGCLKQLAIMGAIGLALIAAGWFLELDDENDVFLLVLGTLAVLASLLWIAPSATYVRAAREAEGMTTEDELRDRYPSEPWRWQHGWNENRIFSGGTVEALSVWFILTVFLLVFGPFAGVGAARYEGGWKDLLPFVGFGAIGLLILTVAVTTTLTSRRFGRSWIVLDTVPGRIGGTIEGWCFVEKGRKLSVDPTIRIACTETVAGRQRERGEMATTHTSVAWSSTSTVPAADVTREGRTIRIPFSFEIPADLQASGFVDDGKKGINWKMTVAVPFEGATFAGEYLVPVF